MSFYCVYFRKTSK